MDLPVIETNIKAASERKPRKCLQWFGEEVPGLYYRMQPRQWQVAFCHIIKLMEYITALTALIHLSAVGAFTGDEWYFPLHLTLSSPCVFLSFLSLAIVLHYDQLLLMLWTPFSPFLTSRHQIISIWAWFTYSLPEVPTESFMSSMSQHLQAVPQGVVLAYRVQAPAAAEWERRMNYGFKPLPSRSECYIPHDVRAWCVTLT